MSPSSPRPSTSLVSADPQTSDSPADSSLRPASAPPGRPVPASPTTSTAPSPTTHSLPLTPQASSSVLVPARFPIMSSHSSSSPDSWYSASGSQRYTLTTPGFSNDPRRMSQRDRQRLVESLRTHRIKTLTELRRIEKLFAAFNSPEYSEPMTSAWSYYVNSNNFLSELRGLTNRYPISSEMVDEAKWMVIEDPACNRSWNYCWLILTKIQDEQLIQKHAFIQAQQPAMWGNCRPSRAEVESLADALMSEWTHAVLHMLRHWDTPPTTTGR